MKVVINRCHGGFGLSNEAFEILLASKGIAFEIQNRDIGFGRNENVYYEAGHLNDDDYYLWDIDFCGDRSDPALVAVVELLGEKANGWASDLKVVEIPDDVEWFIGEYDGMEWVAEQHRTWCE